MPQIKGNDIGFAFYDETSYGAIPGSPDAKKIYPNSFTVQPKQSRTPSEALNGSRAQLEGFLGNLDVSGTLAGEIAPEWFGLILKHALGSVAVTGSGPYTHTFSIGALPAGFGVETDTTIVGSSRYLRNRGLRIASLTITLPQSGPATFSADIMGANVTASSTALDATVTDAGHAGFSGFEASLTEGGSTCGICKSLTITIANTLESDGYVVGGSGVRGQMPEGFVTVTASGQFQFTDSALLAKALNGTETALVATLSRGTGLGAAGNESLVLTLPQGKFDVTAPAISGPAGLVLDLAYTAYKKASTLPLSAVLKCAVAAF